MLSVLTSSVVTPGDPPRVLRVLLVNNPLRMCCQLLKDETKLSCQCITVQTECDTFVVCCVPPWFQERRNATTFFIALGLYTLLPSFYTDTHVSVSVGRSCIIVCRGS